MKSIVITGVSTGIGFATAEYFVNRNYRVFGSVRTTSDAHRLSETLGTHFHPLVFDVTDIPGIQQAADIVSDQIKGNTLTALINNAGIAVSGPLQYVPLDQLELQMRVNVTGLVAVTQAFLPMLGGIKEKIKQPGRVVNLSSVSGIVTSPFMGPYCASKHAVEALSDAMRREFSLYGIKVITIQPGPIQTEIWRKAKEDNTPYPESIYDGYLAGRDKIINKRSDNALPVEKVAQLIWKSVHLPNPKTRYLITAKSLPIRLASMLPDKWVDKLMMKMMSPD